MSALPSTLLALLKIFREKSPQDISVSSPVEDDTRPGIHKTSDSVVLPFSKKIIEIVDGGGLTIHRKHDFDTLSSSFNSAFSFLRDRKPNLVVSSPLLDAVQIQQSSSFQLPALHLDSTERDDFVRSKSDESLSTREEDNDTCLMLQMKLSEDIHSNLMDLNTIENQWRELMLQHDMRIYRKDHGLHRDHTKLINVKR
jgi:hypothetical protein